MAESSKRHNIMAEFTFRTHLKNYMNLKSLLDGMLSIENLQRSIFLAELVPLKVLVKMDVT